MNHQEFFRKLIEAVEDDSDWDEQPTRTSQLIDIGGVLSQRLPGCQFVKTGTCLSIIVPTHEALEQIWQSRESLLIPLLSEWEITECCLQVITDNSTTTYQLLK